MSISFQKSIRSWILQRRNERTAFVAFFAICKRRKKIFFLSKTLVKYKNWYKKYQKFVVFCKNEKFMNKKKTLVVWLKATFVVFEFFRPQIRILEALLRSSFDNSYQFHLSTSTFSSNKHVCFKTNESYLSSFIKKYQALHNLTQNVNLLFFLNPPFPKNQKAELGKNKMLNFSQLLNQSMKLLTAFISCFMTIKDIINYYLLFKIISKLNTIFSEVVEDVDSGGIDVQMARFA